MVAESSPCAGDRAPSGPGPRALTPLAPAGLWGSSGLAEAMSDYSCEKDLILDYATAVGWTPGSPAGASSASFSAAATG